ncbi:unnamed protein product [Prunus brigantina]
MRSKPKCTSKSNSSSKSKSKSKSNSNSKSLALSVFVENVVSEEEAVPLSSYDPELVAAEKCSQPKTQQQQPKCLRRSPRFSPLPDLPPGTEVKSILGNVASGKFENKCATIIRRSPRFTSPVAEAENSKTGTASLQHKKSKRRCMGSNAYKDKDTVSNVESSVEKSVRRPPRLMNHSEAESCCLKVSSQEISLRNLESLEKSCFKAMSLKPSDVEASSRDIEVQHLSLSWHECGDKGPIPLRRSSRLMSAPGNNVSESLKKFDLEKLDEKHIRKSSRFSHCVTERHIRRSPRFSLSVAADEKNSNLNSSIVGLFDSEDERRSSRLMSAPENDDSESLKNVDLEKLDEKHMRRSPIFSHCVNGKEIRRSPRFSPYVASAEKNSNLNSIIFGLSDSKDEFPSKKILKSLGKSDSRIFDEKYLRQSPKEATSMFENEGRETECSLIELPETYVKQQPKKRKTLDSSENRQNKQKKCKSTSLIGDPIPDVEAQERWGWRYQMKSQRSKSQSLRLNEDEEDEIILNVECHFSQAKIGNCIFSLGDCAYIKGDGGKKHVGRILEFFKTTDGENYFRVQWFYKVEDTVIKDVGDVHDKRRLFYSTIMNDNLIDCIVSKVNVKHVSPRVGLKRNSILSSDFYYDMEYCVDYSTFRSLITDNSLKNQNLPAYNSIEAVSILSTANLLENMPSSETYNAELAVLDLYCGCGGMSTGLCLGAKLSRVNLVTRWALDSDKSACESLKLNHPETQVRNEAAEDFLELLKEWEKLCRRYTVNDVERTHPLRSKTSKIPKNSNEIAKDEYEVSRIVDICYGDPNKTGKHGVNFKVHWKGYNSREDTWEPIGGLSNCLGSIQDFVRYGKKVKILPLPGDVDVICGGPPCQGISGYNRYRNVDSPLDDERNHQIVVFMDIVKFLKPKYVLMENVVDILRFDKASLGRYALSRLVHMNYQARLGILAAGCYGLPQFRLRVFLWGAHPCENLPQFPLPTHDVIIRYWPPPEFERNTVAYDEDQPRVLEEALVLHDAISDLPAVTNDETSEEMSYQKPPGTDFQRYIRSTQYEMMGSVLNGTMKTKVSLYDHRPYPLFEDDYLRVCQIPKRKGANFRDLPGVVVGNDNVARRDSTEKHLLLPSGKPLVPDYAFTYEQGKSKRPFARLWWDETVPTVLTFPTCHSQAILHPEQDRILTLRECARLQGFPDYYRFCGTVKERYCQVGNAVAVPVARALGYALGLAVRNLSGNEPLMTLPRNFSHSNYFQFTKVWPLETEE